VYVLRVAWTRRAGLEDYVQLGVVQDAHDMVVITALVDGQLACLMDDDGAAEIFHPRDPEVVDLVKAARQKFGPSARAMTAEEFRLAGKS